MHLSTWGSILQVLLPDIKRKCFHSSFITSLWVFSITCIFMRITQVFSDTNSTSFLRLSISPSCWLFSLNIECSKIWRLTTPPCTHIHALMCTLTHFSFSSVQFSSVTQSCLTLCDPMNRSTPGLPVHHQLPEFTQTHVHQVGAPLFTSSSNLSTPMALLSFTTECLVHACMRSRFSRVRLCETPWTAAHQAPLSTGFSRQEYWGGVPFPSLPYSVGSCET